MGLFDWILKVMKRRDSVTMAIQRIMEDVNRLSDADARELALTALRNRARFSLHATDVLLATDLPNDVRELFNEVGAVSSTDGTFVLGGQMVGASKIDGKFIKIGESRDTDDYVEVAVDPANGNVVELDDWSTPKDHARPERFPTVYHWIVFRDRTF